MWGEGGDDQLYRENCKTGSPQKGRFVQVVSAFRTGARFQESLVSSSTPQQRGWILGMLTPPTEKPHVPLLLSSSERLSSVVGAEPFWLGLGKSGL